MKTVALILLMLCLLQPLACFAYPCDSCLGATDIADSPGEPGQHSHNRDADSCDTTVCCAECLHIRSGITLIYAPLVSPFRLPERNHYLPQVVIPIFVPPQSPC
ncbi:MAG: hypothetical protein ACOYL3_11170 [Desulfuromonadaceae bacterium]